MLKEGAFNHLAAPWNFKFDVYKAHRTALADIARWQREERHKEKEKLAAEQREAARREQQAAVLESIRRRKQELEAAAQREEAETKRRAASQPVVRAVVPEEPPPPPLPKVRGVEFDARAPSKLCSCEEDGPLLELERPEAPPLPPDAETEALLREMIGECHFLMREVAFRSMCQARVLEDRRDWVETSMKLAKTGATVAKAIGKLRHGPSAREVHHFNTVTKVIAAAQGVGGSANPRKQRSSCCVPTRCGSQGLGRPTAIAMRSRPAATRPTSRRSGVTSTVSCAGPDLLPGRWNGM